MRQPISKLRNYLINELLKSLNNVTNFTGSDSKHKPPLRCYEVVLKSKILQNWTQCLLSEREGRAQYFPRISNARVPFKARSRLGNAIEKAKFFVDVCC